MGKGTFEHLKLSDDNIRYQWLVKVLLAVLPTTTSKYQGQEYRADIQTAPTLDLDEAWIGGETETLSGDA